MGVEKGGGRDCASVEEEALCRSRYQGRRKDEIGRKKYQSRPFFSQITSCLAQYIPLLGNLLFTDLGGILFFSSEIEQNGWGGSGGRGRQQPMDYWLVSGGTKGEGEFIRIHLEPVQFWAPACPFEGIVRKKWNARGNEWMEGRGGEKREERRG